MDCVHSSSPSLLSPLEGIRVLDLSRLLPGPFATQILCDLGAEVIKIEDPRTGGDYARFFPPLCVDGNSAGFHALNRGKKSVLLDLKDPKQREKFLQLVPTAHVLVESFRPGVLQRLGIGIDELHDYNPALVVCSISGYGATGPARMRAGHDINYLARAGVLGMMKNPTVLPVQVADICGGAFPAVIQILAALRMAESSGKGALIDISMADCAHSLLAMPLARFHADGKPIGGGVGMLAGGAPCYGIYPTKDGHVTVGGLEPKFWIPMCRALGLTKYESSQFATGPEGEEVRRALTRAFRQRSSDEWDEFFKHRDCCIEVVRSPEHASTRDAQLLSRNLHVTIDVQPNPEHTERTRTQRITLPRMPLAMRSVHATQKPAPLLGQHTDEILDTIPRQRQQQQQNHRHHHRQIKPRFPVSRL